MLSQLLDQSEKSGRVGRRNCYIVIRPIHYRTIRNIPPHDAGATAGVLCNWKSE